MKCVVDEISQSVNGLTVKELVSRLRHKQNISLSDKANSQINNLLNKLVTDGYIEKVKEDGKITVWKIKNGAM